MALVPAIIKALMSSRGGGGGGGYRGGGGGRGGYGGRGGKEPFDPASWLEKEAGKEAFKGVFDFESNRSSDQFMDDVFKFYGRSPYDAPMPDMPDPYGDVQRMSRQ